MRYDDMTAEQEARLPGYARRELSRLRRLLAESETERDELRRQVSGDPEGSDTFVDNWDSEIKQPLGHSPHIRFDLEKNQLRVNLTRDGRSLQVGSSWSGLTITPVASNVIQIAPAGR